MPNKLIDFTLWQQFLNRQQYSHRAIENTHVRISKAGNIADFWGTKHTLQFTPYNEAIKNIYTKYLQVLLHLLKYKKIETNIK